MRHIKHSEEELNGLLSQIAKMRALLNHPTELSFLSSKARKNLFRLFELAEKDISTQIRDLSKEGHEK